MIPHRSRCTFRGRGAWTVAMAAPVSVRGCEARTWTYITPRVGDEQMSREVPNTQARGVSTSAHRVRSHSRGHPVTPVKLYSVYSRTRSAQGPGSAGSPSRLRLAGCPPEAPVRTGLARHTALALVLRKTYELGAGRSELTLARDVLGGALAGVLIELALCW